MNTLTNTKRLAHAYSYILLRNQKLNQLENIDSRNMKRYSKYFTRNNKLSLNQLYEIENK